MPITSISDNCWQNILNVQAQAYTDVLPEALNVLKSKWLASPEMCFVFKNSKNETVGYLLAHSWNSDVPPKLFQELPSDAAGDILYLHDLAVSDHIRGQGVASQLFNKLLESAKTHGYKRILLVAVQKSESYWFKHGFREVPNAIVCRSYGEEALLMCCDVSINNIP